MRAVRSPEGAPVSRHASVGRGGNDAGMGIRSESGPAAPRRAGNGVRSLLVDTSFLRVWSTGALAGTARWLEMLAVGVFTYDLTGSAGLTAAMVFARQLPMVLFGVTVGALADRFDRRFLLLVELALLAAVSAGLAVLAHFEAIGLWHVALGAFIGGCYFVTELPVRRTMLGEIAGPDRVGAALSLDSATNNATRAVGPLVGGTAYQLLGLEGAFVCSLVLYAVAFLLVRPLRYRDMAQAAVRAGTGFLAGLSDGLRFVRARREITGTLAFTIVANLFGFPYAALVPVIGRDTLALEASSIGMLMSAEGLGAFTGSVILANLARPPWYQAIYRGATALFVACLVVFALSPWFLLSLPVLLVAGFGVAGFAAMQMTIIFRSAPPELRSRVMGVLAMCIGAGPIGTLHMGLMADLLGAQAALLLVSLEGVVALVAALVVFRR